MKNVIIGIFGGLLVLYTVTILLSTFNTYSRKNQMEKCLSQSMMSVMERYYYPYMYGITDQPTDSEVVIKELCFDLKSRVTADGILDINVDVCEMRKGIMSVRMSQKYNVPGGRTKTISCTKTILADSKNENY